MRLEELASPSGLRPGQLGGRGGGHEPLSLLTRLCCPSWGGAEKQWAQDGASACFLSLQVPVQGMAGMGWELGLAPLWPGSGAMQAALGGCTALAAAPQRSPHLCGCPASSPHDAGAERWGELRTQMPRLEILPWVWARSRENFPEMKCGSSVPRTRGGAGEGGLEPS